MTDLFKRDGTLKGIRLVRPSGKRPVALIVDVRRAGCAKMYTSFSLEGHDFTQVYNRVMHIVADYYDITDQTLVDEMLASRAAFLTVNKLTTTKVCYDQVGFE